MSGVISDIPGPWANYGAIPDEPWRLSGPSVPPSYAEQIVEEFSYPPYFKGAPDDQFNELLKENIAWHEAPDPIRQSPFWDAGSKVKPDARQWISSILGLNWWGAGMGEETFHIGKLIGYLYAKMYQGHQLPSVIRANIQEPIPTTYGSLYEVSPLVTEAGPAYTSTGFDLMGSDGYPY